MILLWDGILPVIVAAIPPLVAALAPKNDTAEIAVISIVPAVAALIRTSTGARQIRRVNNGWLPARRQVALAIAITFLMLFEIFVAVLTFADDEPAAAWLFPLALFLGYFIAICVALTRQGKRHLNAASMHRRAPVR
jgi:hypothetical protein